MPDYAARIPDPDGFNTQDYQGRLRLGTNPINRGSTSCPPAEPVARPSTSAMTALIGGQHDLGRGVIYGSNIFNVAFLLGFKPLVAGVTVIGRANLILNGGVALVVTLIVSAQSAGLIGATLTGLALAIALIPYFAVPSRHPNNLPQLPQPNIVTGWLVAAITSEQRDEFADERDDRSAGGGRLTTADALSILPLYP